MYRQAVGAEPESATPNQNKELRFSGTGGGGVHRNIRVTLCTAIGSGPQGQRYTPEDTPSGTLVGDSQSLLAPDLQLLTDRFAASSALEQRLLGAASLRVGESSPFCPEEPAGTGWL